MIRFILGLFILLGTAGGLELDALTLRDGVMWLAFGMALILWSLNSLR
jgi:hypothetical protein